MHPIVAKVDHIFVPVEEPEPLFRLFTERLGLPVAWQPTDYGLFESAGVCLGNLNLEIVRGDGSLNPYFEPRLPATIRGIAFEPAMDPDAWDEELDRRALRHTPPFPFEHENGMRLWTTCGLGGLVSNAAVAFLCAYHDLPVVRGDAGRDALRASDGGRLGVECVEEITVGVQDYPAALRRWQRFLDPHRSDEPGTWQVGDGPAIALRESPIDGVSGITVRVRSLDDARAALMDLGLLGPSRSGGAAITYPATYGLDIWLVNGTG